MLEQNLTADRHWLPRLRAGEVAPAFQLPATDGRTVTQLNPGGPLGLVFLRHLA